MRIIKSIQNQSIKDIAKLKEKAIKKYEFDWETMKVKKPEV